MPKHILVINDTQEILELFRTILEDEAGYRVTLQAYSTRDLDEVKQAQPDLIISDHVPTEEKLGWQFLQKLKMDRATEQIPLIICTTMTQITRDNEGWMRAKNVVVIPKPFTIDELLGPVRQLIGPADSAG